MQAPESANKTKGWKFRMKNRTRTPITVRVFLDGKEITLDQVISNTETLPFMDERKIIVIKMMVCSGKFKGFDIKIRTLKKSLKYFV